MIKYSMTYTENMNPLLGLPNRPFIIEIHDDNYIGSVQSLDLVAASLEYIPNEEDLKNCSLLASELAMTFNVQDDSLFNDLIFVEESANRVVLKVDGSEFWQGFLITDQFQKPHLPHPHTISVKATDGIPLLKDIDFPIAGKMTALAVINTCLIQTNLTLGYNIGVNVFEDDMSETTNPLQQVNINTDAFQDDSEAFSCYDVLIEVLTIFYSRIILWNNLWDLDRYDEVLDVTRTKYQVNSSLTETGSVTSWSKNTLATDIIYILNSQLIRTESGWKTLCLSQFYGTLEGSDFVDLGFEDWASSTVLNNWTYTGVAGSLQRNSSGPKVGTFSAQLTSPPVVVLNNFISQTGSVSVTTEFSFEFWVKWNNPENALGNKCRFKLQVGPDYLTNGVTDSWSTTPTIISEPMQNGANAWALIRYASLNPPTGGVPIITFYNGAYDSGPNVTDPWTTSYDAVSLNILNPSPSLQDVIGNKFCRSNDLKSFSRRGFDKEVHIGDVPLGSSYLGALTLASSGAGDKPLALQGFGFR